MNTPHTDPTYHPHGDVLCQLSRLESASADPYVVDVIRQAGRIIAGLTGGAGYPRVRWRTFDQHRGQVPPRADTYLVANDEKSRTAFARWQPRLGKWTFANAAQAFAVTHFSLGPLAPAPRALA